MSVQVKSKLSLPVMFQKIDDINDESKRFIKVKIWLLHLGQNFNGSVFEKEVVDKAIPTLQYVPIVGFIEDNGDKNKKATDDFSDHRYIIVKTENGKEVKKYVGSAYGVILSSEDNNAHYEERLCDDGETRTFLVVDGIMWDMFEDSADIMKRDIIKSHSMELWDDEASYDGYEDENGLFHFTKFSFRAACILGDKYSPAMINSTVEVQFTVSDFIKHIQEELNNKYTEFTKLYSNSTISKKIKSQGGNEIMPNSNTDFQTVMGQFEDISNIVAQKEKITDRWGDLISRYRLVDIQDSEVIVNDRKNYGFYGCSYSVDGDKPVIDFESAKRKKIVYEDYVDGAQSNATSFDISAEIVQIEDKAFQKVKEVNEQVSTIQADYTAMQNKYTEVQALYDDIKPKYDAYVQEEQTRTKATITAEKNQIFTKFESALKENADFISLKEDFEKNLLEEMSVSDIETKCYAIYGKQNMGTNFSTTEQSVKLAIMDDAENSTVVTTKYGNIPISK